MHIENYRKKASLLSKGDSSQEIKQAILNGLALQKVSPRNILDVGCGKGELLGDLRGMFPRAELHGSDLTNFNPNAAYEFLELDLNNTFHDQVGKFDLITSLEVIEHLENPRHFVRELSQCLNPGGLLVLSTPNPESWTSILSFIFRGHHSSFGGKAYPAHITPVPFFDLRNILKESEGMDLMSVHYIPNGRMPGSNLLYRQCFPFVGGKRFSDNYYAISRRV